MHNIRKIFIIVLAGIILIWGVYYVKNQKFEVKTPNNSLQKIKVQAGWLLNGEYANICSAIVNGYYKQEGLDVELLPGGPTGAGFIVSTNAIAQNEDLDIAIDGDIVPLLRGRTKTSPTERLRVKAFAAFWTENPFGFIVRSDSGINSLKDFAKRKPDGSRYKIGITADSVIQDAIAQFTNTKVSDMDLVMVGYDATPFLTGQVDALAAYWTTQAYEVDKAGVSYKFLSASEIPGFNQPSQVALASERTLIEKHDLLVKWLRATIKGNQYNLSYPTESAQQILDSRCGGPNFDSYQEEWLIKKSLSLFDKNKIGSLDRPVIEEFSKTYYRLKQIPRTPDISELVDESVLTEIYR